MEKNLYEILQVSKDATLAEIRKAYRALASKLHPDREGGDKEAFQELQYAFDILYDVDQRAAYDRGEPVGGRRMSQEELIDKMAMEKILACLDSTLSTLPLDQVSHFNFPKEILAGCQDARGKIKNARKETRQQLAVVRQMRRRILKAEMYIYDHLQSRRRHLIAQWKQIKFETKIVDRIEEVTRAMEYKVDKRSSTRSTNDFDRAVEELMRMSGYGR